MARARKRRVLSGLGAATKRKKRATKKTGGCKRVSRKAAQRKVKGRTVLKRGCRYLKGDGAKCCPTGGTRKRTTKKRTTKKRTAKKTASKKHVYSAKSTLVFKKAKGGKRVLKKGCSRISSGADKGKIACKRKMSRRRKAA